MIFGKKNTEPERTFADRTLLEARNELSEIGWRLNDKIEKIFIREKALSLYIPGDADYEKAEQDLYNARLSLKNTIAEYDDKAAAIERFKKAHAEEITVRLALYDDSHGWIEKTVKRLFKKG